MIKYERELFNLIKERIADDLQVSEHKMSKYDCYSLVHNSDIELKCRNIHYDDLLIEKAKYDALIQRAAMFGTIPVYINSTPIGVWSFRLSELPEPKWEERRMPKTTHFTNNNMIVKMVGYYNISLGKDITELLGLSK
jgi:hypothetical protein